MLIHSTGDTLMYYYKNTNQEFYRVISYKGTRVIFDEQQKDNKRTTKKHLGCTIIGLVKKQHK